MKLYYMAGACSLASHIVLEWIGKPYQTQRLSHDELKQDAYLKVNPAGAVPAMDFDGWVLTENVAILHYLADINPGARLSGDGSARERAEVNRWLGMVNSDMHPVFKPLFGATAYLDDEAAVQRSKEHAKTTLRAQFERVNQQLQGRDWLAGNRSIADPYLFVLLRWAGAMGIDLSDLANLDAFMRRMQKDAGVKKALQDEGLA